MADDFDILGIDNIRAVLCGDIRTREREQAEIQWRVPGESGKADTRTITLYPAVFNQETVLYESAQYVVKEVIAPGFFDDVLGDDMHLNYVHESPSAMARNRPHMPPSTDGVGCLDLSVDAHGLRAFAILPMDDVDVQRIEPKMRRSVVDQASFAFTVAEEDYMETTDGQGRTVSLYTLRKCRRLYDVCVAPLGAYSQTEALLRSVFATQVSGRSQEGHEIVPVRSQEGQEGGEGRAQAGRPRKRAALLAESTVAAMHVKPMEDITWIPE
ncbi:MAG TPA: HK97 family phage prohead protease [Coriobacteriia bacterium]